MFCLEGIAVASGTKADHLGGGEPEQLRAEGGSYGRVAYANLAKGNKLALHRGGEPPASLQEALDVARRESIAFHEVTTRAERSEVDRPWHGPATGSGVGTSVDSDHGRSQRSALRRRQGTPRRPSPPAPPW